MGNLALGAGDWGYKHNEVLGGLNSIWDGEGGG